MSGLVYAIDHRVSGQASQIKRGANENGMPTLGQEEERDVKIISNNLTAWTPLLNSLIHSFIWSTRNLLTH